MHKQIKEAKKTYKQTIGPCQDPTDHTVPRMEELFMRAFSRATPFFLLSTAFSRSYPLRPLLRLVR